MANTPSQQDWLTRTPMYKEYDYRIKTKENNGDIMMHSFNESEAEEEAVVNIKKILWPSKSIDMYCIKCKSVSTFHPYVPIHYGITVRPFNDELHNSLYTCVRTECGNENRCLFNLEKFKLTKIGQYPSLADLLSPDLKKYAKAKILSKDLMNDWQRAIGLNAHGIGVGSFVYLRRILENIVKNTAIQAREDDSTFDMDKFEKERWPEKVKLLSKYLPNFLVDNAKIYSILSIGIHALSEDKCLGYFAAMHTSIEVICDQKLKQKEEADKEQQAKNSIASILDEIK